MIKQLSLFQVRSLTEEKLSAILEPFLPRFWRIVREPFEDLVARRADDPAFRLLEDGECAQWLRPQIIQMAREEFRNDQNVNVEKRRCQHYIRISDDLIVVPKKLTTRDRDLHYSSYPTSQNKTFWLQHDLDGIPRLPRIILGYEFCELLSDVRVWIAYPVGRRVAIRMLVPPAIAASSVMDDQPVYLEDADQNGFVVKVRTPKSSLNQKKAR